MIGLTGRLCLAHGTWRSSHPTCHPAEIRLSEGETFPPCWSCHRAVIWTLVIYIHNY